MGEINGKPAMQIVGDFYLTNITQVHEMFLERTYFVAYYGKWWFPSTLRVEGKVLVKNHFIAEGAPGRYEIPPGYTYEGHAGWLIQSPI
jgi:hypothetical protein